MYTSIINNHCSPVYDCMRKPLINKLKKVQIRTSAGAQVHLNKLK